MQKIVVLLAACLLFTTTAQGQKWGLPWLLKPTLTDCDRLVYGLANEQLIVVQKGQLFGLKDKNGKEVLPYEYTQISVGADGVVRARQGGTTLWLNVEGKSFGEGLSLVTALPDGRFLVKKGALSGVVGKSMQLEVPIEYKVFEEGDQMLLVKGAERIALGPTILPTHSATEVPTAAAMPEWPGVSLYADPQTHKVGIQNKKGKPLTPAIYQIKKGFDFGYAIASKGDNKWGVLRADGQELSPFVNDAMDGLSPALIAFVQRGNEFNLLDVRADTLLFKPKLYRKIEVLAETPPFFKVFLLEKQGVLNAKGNVVVPPVYDQVVRKGEYWVVCMGPQTRFPVYGLFNLAGKELEPLDTVKIHVFPNQTLALEREDHTLQHLSATGEVLATFPAGTASVFAQSWVLVKDAQGKRYYHSTSTPAQEVWLDEVRALDSEHLEIVQKGAFYGVMHPDGQVLVPPVVELVRASGAYVYVKYEGKWGVLRNTFY